MCGKKYIRSLFASVLALCVACSVICPSLAIAEEALGDVDTPRSSAATTNEENAASSSANETNGSSDASSSASGTNAESANEATSSTNSASTSPDASSANSASTSSETSDSTSSATSQNMQISRDSDAALESGASFGVSEFSRAQKGSNRDIDDTYYGYSYLVGSEAGTFVQLIATNDYVVCYIPSALIAKLDLEITANFKELLKNYLCALDANHAAGSKALSSYNTWYFTTDKSYDVDAVRFNFDQEIEGGIYASVIGVDRSDLTDSENPNYLKPVFADYAKLLEPSAISIVQAPEGFAAITEFLANLDYSPLWVSLRTTGIAIVIIFVLGLLAAYLCLNVSQKVKNVLDVIFTIPMVLPPTVCGFILLFACGSNTAFGRFFIDIGFPLIFSPVACIIAAVVVAFPLMYRNALGAFDGLDRNMLDAARTLGWSNAKVFVKLMLPLSWNSIAAGAVLAFARALGEFGATLFMAGNYVGITRTIPIAIYFEWMNGNSSTAWFWTAVIIVFSFFVILFINLWTSHNTKYRKREQN